jgi:NAD(P)-dependent dehydrogenase (short-subunit alcohol dehydrogenase family)
MVSTRQAVIGGAIATGLLGRELLQRSREEDLRGQVALITGGSRGLGLAMARVLADEGCKLVICSRDEEEIKRASKELSERGAEVIGMRGDVANQAEVEQLVAIGTARFGPIDLLINNAGVIQVGPLETCRLDDFQQAMDIMFWGTLYPTLSVLPSMRERQSGRIVNITSIGGRLSMAHMLPYDAAKFAATGLSEGLHAELAKDGISVTTITPGLMRTGSHFNAIFKGKVDEEFTWFSLGASLPVISMDADRAARQIIGAAKRRETDRVISFPAMMAARVHGVAPGATADIISFVNRFLPKANGNEAMKGIDVESSSPNRLRDSLTAMGRSAAERFNQFSENPMHGRADGPYESKANARPGS